MDEKEMETWELERLYREQDADMAYGCFLILMVVILTAVVAVIIRRVLG